MQGTLKKIVFAGITTVLVLVAAEGVARLAKSEVGRASIPEPEIQVHVENGAMKYHPELGWVRAELPLWSQGLNTDGFRYGKDVERAKPDGHWRAFALGDSQTYGAGVDWQESYPAVAEAELHATHGAEGVQLINAGISGYGSLQSLKLIRHQLLDFDPDLIIVDAQTRDDLRDDLVHATAGTSRLQELLFYSRAYYFLRVAVERTTGGTGRRMSAQALPPPGKHQRDNTYGNHDLIWELGKREGFEVLFVNYPVQDREGGVACLGLDAELPEGAHIARVCEALQDSGYTQDELFFDTNHLRPLGCEISGKALAAAIEEYGLGPAGP
ncbi:MAG: SGNH/GDSL hydrolase family protein [Proteobacteria bacterium]|nr:SGNH/GDSL hydrolase family protein [Pseudomonadota bacterium]